MYEIAKLNPGAEDTTHVNTDFCKAQQQRAVRLRLSSRTQLGQLSPTQTHLLRAPDAGMKEKWEDF